MLPARVVEHWDYLLTAVLRGVRRRCARLRYDRTACRQLSSGVFTRYEFVGYFSLFSAASCATNCIACSIGIRTVPLALIDVSVMSQFPLFLVSEIPKRPVVLGQHAFVLLLGIDQVRNSPGCRSR